MRRVLFLTTYASPYRVTFFDELGKDMEVTVLFSDRMEKQKHRSAEWFTQSEGNFRPVQLTRHCGAVGGKDICLDVIHWLKQPFDHIILCGYSSPTVMLAMAWLKLHKKPFWLEVDGGLIRQDSALKYRYKKMLVGAASGWLSTGRATTEYLCHYGADPERVQVYPFTSLRQAELLERPVTREEKQVLRRELGLTGERVILSIGQFIHRKGFDVLMKAAATLEPGTEIYIVGGAPTEEYMQLCRELGLTNIHFEGFRKKEQLASYYKAADLFVLPTREDIWGLVVNEAMAYGLPVVTTDRCVAGLELVKNGVNGYIIPTEEPDALADAIGRAFSQDADQMAVAALEAVRPYTIENMAKVHVDILNTRS